MAAPWEKYQSARVAPRGKPWERYAQKGPDFSMADEAPDDPDVKAAYDRKHAPRGSIVNPAAQGLLAGFADEVGGVMGGVASTIVGKGFRTGYEAIRDAVRGDEEAYRERHPVASTVAEIAGAIPTLAVPGLGPGRGVALGARVAQGAKAGAIYGGVSGAGYADGDLGDRAIGAATGAAVGGALGGAVPLAAEGVKAAVSPAVRTVRGMINPDKEAARRVATALQRDAGDPQAAINQIERGRNAGSPLIPADVGETSQALARSAANTSPEARAALSKVVDDRFETQNTRAETMLRGLVRTPANATVTRDALEDAARKSRKPYYDRAYQAGSGGIWDADLDRLSQSPVMQKAMRDAVASIENKSATGRAMSPTAPNGAPTLEYWDQVKRNIDSAWNVAKRAGDKELAADLDATRRALLSKLDQAVPEYADARGVAAALFGANDALDAGEKFVLSRMPIAEARKAFMRMTPEEKDLFREGFTSKLIDDLRATPDRRTVLGKIAASKDARERIGMLFGPRGMQKVEAFTLLEEIMDKTRHRLQGNSTTARQLAELGLAGGAGFAISGGNIYDPNAWFTAAFLYGGRRGLHKIDQRVVKKVGELLASQNPDSVRQAIELITRSPQFMAALRSIENSLGRSGTNVARPAALDITVPVAAGEQDRQQPGQGR